MNLRRVSALAALLVASTGLAIARQMTVDINHISNSGVGEKIGSVMVSEGKGGVSFKVSLKGLPAAQRGFHVHEKGDCGPGNEGRQDGGRHRRRRALRSGRPQVAQRSEGQGTQDLPLLKGNAS